MKTGPVNSYSLKWSIALHSVLLFAAVVVPLLPAFRPKEIAIPVDFTVVLDQNLIAPNVPPEAEPEPPKKAEPQEPEKVPDPEPPKPVPLPDPPKDAVVIEPKKEPEKKPEKKPDKPPEKKVEKPPEKKPEKPPEKKPFVMGRRIEAPKKPAQPKFEDLYKPYDPKKATSVKPRHRPARCPHTAGSR